MSVLDIFLAVIGISVLVIVHETGHYLAARSFGMRVTRFSIGLGPTLFRYQPKGSPTIFQVCAIPFLAYVQIAGMNPAEEVDPADPGLYPNKSLIARAITIFAGPFANYLTASLLVFGLAVAGWPEETPTEPMTIAEVTAASPAAKAGLRPGDVLTYADGKPVKTVRDLINATSPRAGKPTVYKATRDGKELVLTITPTKSGTRGIIGVAPKTVRRYHAMAPADAVVAAVVFPFKLTVAQLVALADRLKHRSIEGVAGPVGMGKLVAEQAGQGVAEYVSILMLLSVALGMFNLLPIPALDGGRLVFLGYELIARRRPNERFEAVVHAVGLLLLLSLLVIVTFRDVIG